jgi:serine/threonine-protein kinase HipA
MITDAEVFLWGTKIGAVSWFEDREVGAFQYDPNFVGSEIEVAPLMMPLNDFPYEFPVLSRNTFMGLPGLVSDSLPDKFGNRLIDEWLASQGRAANDFNPVERLCYVGSRGMGALEFKPALNESLMEDRRLEVKKLVELTNEVLNERLGVGGVFRGTDDKGVIEDILRVGTSAGGARAKAVLAWNRKTNEFRSGQLNLEPGFEHWIMKFDGVSNNRDKELADPLGYGRIEYAYYLMATAVGIEMSECTTHEEGGRCHFMTKRFDRTDSGQKVHMQSLCAMAHFDYNDSASYSYEQAMQVMKQLGMTNKEIEQQFLRAVFNVVARNHDDHVKNIAYLMDRQGNWKLSPAFDITYAWDPNGIWTSRHQMSINKKRDFIEREDFLKLARMAGIKRARANTIINKVCFQVRRWKDFGVKAGLDQTKISKIKSAHLTNM